MTVDFSKISLAAKRSTVQVTFPDGRTLEGPLGLPIEAFVRKAALPKEPPIVAALFRRTLCELSCPIEEDGELIPLDSTTADGSRIYRRSLVFLLLVAAREIFPATDVAVDHSLSNGGYFCMACGRSPFSPEELSRIEARMQEIAKADEPIARREVPLAEAVEIFQRQGYEDKVRLLRVRKKDYLTLYILHGIEDYFHGYMLPSTGYLRKFGLEHSSSGFTLRFPRSHMPDDTLTKGDFPKLRATFQEYGEWQDRLGLEDVGMLNEAVEKGRGQELILVAEALHDQKTAEIARKIVAGRDRIRLVLIAGPSSSGKTTFSRRLAIQMLSQGLRPYPLEMDNYFVDRQHTPHDEFGQPDFESFEALDRVLLSENLQRLMRGEEVVLPRFDFQDGIRKPGDAVRLPEGAMIVMEGIHGLNPELLANFRQGEVYRIYVSALTQLNLDRHNRISTTDSRLIRRIVRDVTKRGHSPGFTIAHWEMVRRGERRNIFPFQENANIMFNSALIYELAVLRPIAEPLLLQVDPDAPEYVEAKRLMAFLAWFRPLSSEYVPDDSILREFIGDSIMEQFRVWGS